MTEVLFAEQKDSDVTIEHEYETMASSMVNFFSSSSWKEPGVAEAFESFSLDNMSMESIPWHLEHQIQRSGEVRLPEGFLSVLRLLQALFFLMSGQRDKSKDAFVKASQKGHTELQQAVLKQAKWFLQFFDQAPALGLPPDGTPQWFGAVAMRLFPHQHLHVMKMFPRPTYPVLFEDARKKLSDANDASSYAEAKDRLQSMIENSMVEDDVALLLYAWASVREEKSARDGNALIQAHRYLLAKGRESSVAAFFVDIYLALHFGRKQDAKTHLTMLHERVIEERRRHSFIFHLSGLICAALYFVVYLELESQVILKLAKSINFAYLVAVEPSDGLVHHFLHCLGDFYSARICRARTREESRKEWAFVPVDLVPFLRDKKVAARLWHETFQLDDYELDEDIDQTKKISF